MGVLVTLYGGAGNLLTFVYFCDKNMGVWVSCSAGYNLENMVIKNKINGLIQIQCCPFALKPEFFFSELLHSADAHRWSDHRHGAN